LHAVTANWIILGEIDILLSCKPQHFQQDYFKVPKQKSRSNHFHSSVYSSRQPQKVVVLRHSC